MIQKLTSLLIICCSLAVNAQQPAMLNLSESNGLPDKEFYDILEDEDGFIWLAADKGLFRYDGHEYKSYSNSEKRGLSVFNLTMDGQGRIWCCNISGQFFYVENDSLSTFVDLKHELDGKLSNFFLSENELIIPHPKKIIGVNLINKKVEVKHDLDGSFNNHSCYKSNNLYVNSEEGVLRFDSDFNVTPLFSTLSDNSRERKVSKALFRPLIFSIKEDVFLLKEINSRGVLFIVQDDTFHLIAELYNLKDLVVYDVFTLHEEVWISTNQGVQIFTNENNTFEFKRQLLDTDRVTGVLVDKDNNHWLTTKDNGVYIIPNMQVIHHKIPKEIGDVISIEKVAEDKIIFVTNLGNVGVYDIESNVIRTKKIIGSSRASDLIFDENNNVTYLSCDKHSYSIDNNSLDYSKSPLLLSIKGHSWITDSTFICGNYSTVNVFNSVSVKGKNISSDSRMFDCHYSSKSQRAYVSGVDNLLVFDSLWNPSPVLVNGEAIYASTITETSNGMIWVATYKNGVYGIKDDQIKVHYTIENGCISNEIGLIKADKNALWICTSNGIQVFDTELKSFKTLTKRDGIISYNIFDIEFIQNKVVFSFDRGLFSLDKTKSFKALSQPKVYFNQVEINENSVELREDYTLDYDQTAIKFSFNATGFQFNQNSKFDYRLLGYNDNWTNTDSGVKSTKYSSLSPGTYVFQVRPSSDLGYNKNNFSEVNFSIRRAFWTTWWFLTLCALLIIFSVAGYYIKLLKQKENEKQLAVKQLSSDNELIFLKLENLRSQMNPHFIFNALNSIQEYIMFNEKKLAGDYLVKFADLMRIYLVHSSKGTITLKEEVNCLNIYLELEKLRFEDKLNYTIDHSKITYLDDINIPTMLVQPYVENALNHGLMHVSSDRVLDISFDIDSPARIIKCLITDNGIGRKKAQLIKEKSHKNHDSFASKATNDRLMLMNYRKEKQIGVVITDLVENNEPKGTRVEISIPYTSL